MLAIAAVTLSTMHQSSLGSLFLLMPDTACPAVVVSRDAHLFLPVFDCRRHALIILVEMWIAKGWGGQLRIAQLAAMGKITFWSLLVYLALPSR